MQLIAVTSLPNVNTIPSRSLAEKLLECAWLLIRKTVFDDLKLAKLFEPVSVGSMKLRNRIVMAAFNSHQAARDGAVTPRLVSFLRERAKGGAGLVTTGFAFVDKKASQASLGQLGAHDDLLVEGLNLLAEALQNEGSRASLQIAHCGRQKTITGPIVAPSSVPWSPSSTGEKLTPTELTTEEIGEIIEAFGEAARRGKQAGFDAVEIHGGHGYLITNFLSPRTNRRRDCYGGSFENRASFLLEVVERVKERTAADFPIICKISVDEYEKDGITINESTRLAKELEDAGVDAIVASAGCHEGPYEIPPMFLPPGVNVHLAHRVKKAVGIPVIAIGAINDAKLAERIVQEGKADLVAMARPLVADPYLPIKAQKGEFEDIRKCIRCNQTCCERSAANLETRCAINPAAGRELDFALEPVAKSKRVVVVGGGPAGMEAARTAALRGHEVTLYEKNKLGGQLLLAAVPPGKEEINSLTRFLSIQVRKLAEIRIGVRATSELIEEDCPDAVVVATGAKLVLPDIPGIHGPSVTTFQKALLGQASIGQHVLVLGGGEIGLETAYSLSRDGHEVTILTRMPQPAPKMEPSRRAFIMQDLLHLGSSFLTCRDVQAISEDEAVVYDRTGSREIVTFDSAVVARGLTSDRWLLEQLQDKNRETYAIGDCVRLGRIEDAVHEAARVASRI